MVLIDAVVPDLPVDEERFLTHLDADLARVGRPLALVWTEPGAALDQRLASRGGRQVGPASVPGVRVIAVGDRTVVALPAVRALVTGTLSILDPRLRAGLDLSDVESVIPADGDPIRISVPG